MSPIDNMNATNFFAASPKEQPKRKRNKSNLKEQLQQQLISDDISLEKPNTLAGSIFDILQADMNTTKKTALSTPDGLKDYGKYRKKQLEDGQFFEKYCCALLHKKTGMCIHVIDNLKEQYSIGESQEGIEFKFDKRYNGDDGKRPTGNLYIEKAEKIYSGDNPMMASGVWRDDNTKYWVIGTPSKRIFIFEKKTLRVWILTQEPVNNKFGTSIGYVMPEATAVQLAINIINNPESILKFDETEINKVLSQMKQTYIEEQDIDSLIRL